jgi:hypothetical protein
MPGLAAPPDTCFGASATIAGSGTLTGTGGNDGGVFALGDHNNASLDRGATGSGDDGLHGGADTDRCDGEAGEDTVTKCESVLGLP